MIKRFARNPPAREHRFAIVTLPTTTKPMRVAVLLLALSLTLHAHELHADSTVTTSAISPQGKVGIDCTQAFLSEFSAPSTTMTLPHGGPMQTDSTTRKLDSPCKRHPWLREVNQWKTQGMPLEVAVLWLITQPDTEIHPQWPGELADLARMQAAATLAKSGLLPEAQQLWSELSIRRPEWAEVRFNQALSLWLAGQTQPAMRHLEIAIGLCRLRACAIAPELLTQWQNTIGQQP